MKQYFEIVDVLAREILDSRGLPTLEVEVTLDEGTVGRAQVASAADSAPRGAAELRDGDKKRYGGKGVLTAVESVNGEIAEAMLGLNVLDQPYIDKVLCELDGTEDKSRLGANALSGVSLACARAGAEAVGLSLYNYIGGCNAKLMPVPLVNLLSAGNRSKAYGLLVQELMLVPVGADSFADAARMSSEVFQTLRKMLPAAPVGEGGGLTPNHESDEALLDLALEAIDAAGYVPGEDFLLAIEGTLSDCFEPTAGLYRFSDGSSLSREELIARWEELTEEYPVISFENCMGVNDMTGWRQLTAALGGRVQIVRGGVPASDPEFIREGLKMKASNSVLIQLNQAGTLTETLDAVNAAKRAGWTTVVSCRWGETEDTCIADLAVAVGAGQIKIGAPFGSERTAKYNQLLRIEEELFDVPCYPGQDAFYSLK